MILTTRARSFTGASPFRIRSSQPRRLPALRLEDTIAARAKANMIKGTNQHSPKQNSAEASHHVETREEIAKLAGVSRDTVDKVKQIEKLGGFRRGGVGVLVFWDF